MAEVLILHDPGDAQLFADDAPTSHDAEAVSLAEQRVLERLARV